MNHSAGILAAVVLMGWAVGASAASGSVEMRLRALESRLPDADRLAAMEKLQGSQGAGVLAGEVEQLKTEIRELRGQIEQLTHQLQKQQHGQGQLYGDLDKRLQALEAKAAAQLSSVASPILPETGIPTGPQSGSGVSMAPSNAEQEQAHYMAAFELLQQGKTSDAIPAFQSFLEKYPTGSFAGNAMYWLGEANYVNKNYPQALIEFQKLVDTYPGSSKLSGALLKIGYIHYEAKRYPEARAVLEKVKGGYPNTNVGALAAERLARMRKEGV